jgi:hypothetical protein
MAEKEITCTSCGKRFEDSIYYRQCSNCFACTGCEIYTCPHCGATVEIVPIKAMKLNIKKENDLVSGKET